MCLVAGFELPQKFHAFAERLEVEQRDAGDVSARTSIAGDKSSGDRIGAHREHDRNPHIRPTHRTEGGPLRHDHLGTGAKDFADPPRQRLRVSIAVPLVDDEVAALEVAELAQPVTERRQKRGRNIGAVGGDPRDVQCSSRLRMRPRSGGDRQQGQGDARGASIHWITSSARSNTDFGITRSSSLAVCRLITNSNLVGCSIGKSPGRAPCRILAT